MIAPGTNPYSATDGTVCGRLNKNEMEDLEQKLDGPPPGPHHEFFRKHTYSKSEANIHHTSGHHLFANSIFAGPRRIRFFNPSLNVRLCPVSLCNFLHRLYGLYGFARIHCRMIHEHHVQPLAWKPLYRRTSSTTPERTVKTDTQKLSRMRSLRSRPIRPRLGTGCLICQISRGTWPSGSVLVPSAGS